MFHPDNVSQSFWHKRFGPTAGAIILFALEVIQIAIISAAIIIPIRFFLIQPFYVKGASMEPNYYNREYLIIDEISYRFTQPKRGEIVVFRYPRDPSEFFIKRIIGLPGDTVEITDGRIAIYNDEHPSGIILDEEYLFGESTPGEKKTTLNENEYFVLGDNRDASLDSRNFGPVTDEHIVGRMWLRGLPLSRMGAFSLPEYNL